MALRDPNNLLEELRNEEMAEHEPDVVEQATAGMASSTRQYLEYAKSKCKSSKWKLIIMAVVLAVLLYFTAGSIVTALIAVGVFYIVAFFVGANVSKIKDVDIYIGGQYSHTELQRGSIIGGLVRCYIAVMVLVFLNKWLMQNYIPQDAWLMDNLLTVILVWISLSPFRVAIEDYRLGNFIINHINTVNHGNMYANDSELAVQLTGYTAKAHKRSVLYWVAMVAMLVISLSASLITYSVKAPAIKNSFDAQTVYSLYLKEVEYNPALLPLSQEWFEAEMGEENLHFKNFNSVCTLQIDNAEVEQNGNKVNITISADFSHMGDIWFVDRFDVTSGNSLEMKPISGKWKAECENYDIFNQRNEKIEIYLILDGMGTSEFHGQIIQYRDGVQESESGFTAVASPDPENPAYLFVQGPYDNGIGTVEFYYDMNTDSIVKNSFVLYEEVVMTRVE